MKGASLDSVLTRLMEGTNSKTLSALGPALGVTSQAIYDAKKRGKIPDRWIAIACRQYELDPNWLLQGSDKGVCKSADEQDFHKQENLLDRLAKTERELELERQERRSLSVQLQETITENRQLWKENADLRERVARMEEQLNKPGTIQSSTQACSVA